MGGVIRANSVKVELVINAIYRAVPVIGMHIVAIQPCVETGLQRRAVLHALDINADIDRTKTRNNVAALRRGHQIAAIEGLLVGFLDDLILIASTGIHPAHGVHRKLSLITAARQHKGKAHTRLSKRGYFIMRHHVIIQGIGQHVKGTHDSILL